MHLLCLMSCTVFVFEQLALLLGHVRAASSAKRTVGFGQAA